MQSDTSLGNIVEEMDFAALLEQSLAESQLERGDTVRGTILAVDPHGLIVDVGWKHDGVVYRQDIERMGKIPSDFTVDEEISVTVVRLADELILSALLAKQDEDWISAEKLMNEDDVWLGEISEANRGGLIVPFGNLRGFIPASHVTDMPRTANEDERHDHLQSLVGKTITVKVIEVNSKRRRLVFSQRYAQRDTRDAKKQHLLSQLKEGDVVEGIVSGLRDFGAFVDLGGADGLVHISELAWHRVKHPSEIVNIGDTVNVYILHLDDEGKRIGLSLKRLQDNPWSKVDELYHVGQLIQGEISRLADFGAFITLDPGIEALLHVSQISDDQHYSPKRHLNEGQKLLLRVISIEAEKQRLGLSFKDVSKVEKEQWDGDVDNDDIVTTVEEAEMIDENVEEFEEEISEEVPVETIES